LGPEPSSVLWNFPRISRKPFSEALSSFLIPSSKASGVGLAVGDGRGGVLAVGDGVTVGVTTTVAVGAGVAVGVGVTVELGVGVGVDDG
jgi:hypothetical protein